MGTFNRFYILFFKKHRVFISFLIILIVFGVITANISPYIYGKMIDVVTIGSVSDLPICIAAYFAITIVSMALGMYESYIGEMFAFKVNNEVKLAIFEKILRLRFKKLDALTTGELISRLEFDTNAIVDFCLNLVTSIALISFNLIVSLYFVFSISAGLSIIAILFIPLTALNNIVFRSKFKVLSKQEKELHDKYYSFVDSTFANIKGIRSFMSEGASRIDFLKFTDKKLSILKRTFFLSNFMNIGSQAILLVFTLFTIYTSARFIIEGKLTIGNMVAFNTYVGKLFDSVSRILAFNIQAQTVSVSADRIFGMLDDDSEVLNAGLDLGDIRKIKIKNLKFSYFDGVEIFKGISIDIDKPGLYSIVGRNGCGKSTLAKILMGFYEIQSGVVYLNDKDICEIKLLSLRDNITYAQKEVFIINDSLIENVKLANPKADETEVADVCRKAEINELEKMLINGLKTKLGEDGNLLSSGQKQKINIARALLKHSSVLLLDEITSDLDGKFEKKVMDLLSEVAKNSIVIFISHKLSSVEKSDCIFLIDNGEIQDFGKHLELLSRNVLYKELFEKEAIEKM
ncbi:MAG: ABC transporter ATP-binding protein/permease [Clostridiales bacterium]|nr:ABC transporter ATP-binding protein/permease [Clostridiales bacterium]